MVINFLVIPSNRLYGFEGVSEDEFSVYTENVFDVMALTPLRFITEKNPQTDASAYLWADKDRNTFYITNRDYRLTLEPILPADDVNDISDRVYDLFLYPKYDLFTQLSQSEKADLAQAIVKMLE